MGIALGDIRHMCLDMGWFHGNDCWWVVGTGVWVPAPDRVEGRPFAGMTGGGEGDGWGGARLLGSMCWSGNQKS